MNCKEIVIGQDYSPVPGGRYIKHGDFSGEHFREAVLVPALREVDKVIVYLDGTVGYAGSFLEEAFGGLIRESGFSYENLLKKLVIKAKAPRYEIYRRMAEQYLKEADSASRARVA